MSACATQVFNQISPDRYASLIQQAADAGIIISGNAGSATKDSITIRWAYDPNAQTLELQCTASPFFVSCGTINQKIHDLVDQGS